VLGFTSYTSGGDITPSFEADLAAASSLYFSSDETDGNTGNETVCLRTELYANSTASGDVLIYDLATVTPGPLLQHLPPRKGFIIRA
jgi:hypothetical protein